MESGEPIELAATGERIVFRLTAAASAGEAVVFESLLPPAAVGLAVAAEAGQEQRFEVLRGSVTFLLGGGELVASAGDRVTVPRGTSCRYWNASSEPAHLVSEVRPALEFESFVASGCQPVG